MSRKVTLDTRSIVVWGLIGMVGLFLLMLITPSLWYGSGPLALSMLFGLIPLAVLIAILVFLFGKSRPIVKSHRILLKRLAIAVVASSILSIAVTAVSDQLNPFAPGTWYYFLQNTGVAMNFAAAATGLLLVNYQRFMYWPLWSRSDKNLADERQKYVRQRVFEKAYTLNILIALLVGASHHGASQRMQSVLTCVLLTSIVFLPAVIATQQQDS